MTSNSAQVFIDSTTVGISDSFVDNSNKIGAGNGEAKLYLGQEDSQEFKSFFGDRGFQLECRLHKSDLNRFMEEIKPFYFNPFYDYRGQDDLKMLWHERMKKINEMPSEIINFHLQDQTQIEPPRIYAKSEDLAFSFLRILPLSNLAKLIIVKYRINSKHVYDFKLVLDLPASLLIQSQSEVEEILKAVQIDPSLDIGSEILRIRKERVGQDKFRAEVLKDCGHFCPFTGVNDASLLIAGHIKPWAISDPHEKVDPRNGFAFTPTYDKMFNDGLISFTNRGALLISPLVSLDSRKNLNLNEGDLLNLPIKLEKHVKRLDYLNYHREKVFRT